MSRSTVNRVLSFLVLPVLLIGIGWFANDWHNHYFRKKVERRVMAGGYKFISPLLDVELPEGYSVNHEPIPFKRKIAQFVEQQIRLGRAINISVYYRDLSDGPWFGINEDEKYNPASLTKVPIMVAWLRRADKDPAVLKQKFLFDEKNYGFIPPQTINAEHMIKKGATYTVEELLNYMMRFSDNNSREVLYRALSSDEISSVINSMDVNRGIYGNYDNTTVHGYSGFFRILFNASFLSKEMSEKALQIMSEQSFKDGLIAGLPAGTVVSSKFGEYNTKEHPEINQFHEFGIVYHPKGPYILGILTRGHNRQIQTEIVSSISSLVYNAVNTSITDKR